MIRTILITAGLLALAACDKGPRELRLVTPDSLIDRDIVEELVELFNNDQLMTEVSLTEEPLSEEAALDAIAAGEADIALISNSLDFRPDIATVMPLYPTVLHIARAGNEIPEGPEGLRNAAVFAGTQGSASRRVFERIAEQIGVGDDEFRYVTDPDEMAEIVVVFAPISPERIAEFPDLVLSSIGTADEIGAGGIVDAAVLLNPHFRRFVIPLGTYGDATPEPIITIAVDKILVTRSSLDNSVVYDLINDILRLRPALAAKRPGLFQHLSEDFDASRSRFVLHSGTQSYLQRSAPTVYERYSGVAEVTVTLMIALFSAALAGVRIYKMRRKNRIDTFYARALELRRSGAAASSDEGRQRVIDEVRDLQSTAFELLVDEKLAADESFRIFITLSNDVLHQLGALVDNHRASDA